MAGTDFDMVASSKIYMCAHRKTEGKFGRAVRKPVDTPLRRPCQQPRAKSTSSRLTAACLRELLNLSATVAKNSSWPQPQNKKTGTCFYEIARFDGRASERENAPRSKKRRSAHAIRLPGGNLRDGTHQGAECVERVSR